MRNKNQKGEARSFLFAKRHRFWRQEFLLFNEMHLSACRDTFVASFSHLIIKISRCQKENDDE